MRHHKNRLTVLLAVALVMVMMIGTLALFTDRATAEASGTAGTLNLELSPAFAVSSTDGLKPGTKVDITYTLVNQGNKSADVLEKLVLVSPVALSDDSELEIYAAGDVVLNASSGLYEPKADATPLSVRSISADKKTITYAIPEYILNGTGTAAETESGITTNTKTGSYVLLMKASAGNEFANQTINLWYEAQAKQHRNTNSATWTTIQTVETNFAGELVSVVPAVS